jgi:maleylacetate reductase
VHARRVFVYTALPARVLFGVGTLARAADELARLGVERPLVLTRRRELPAALASAARFDGAVMHTPTAVTERALAALRAANADGVVAIGGGSTIGLAKALAVRTDLPQLAIPTTYSGSEMTPVLGETENGIKTTRKSPAILPETVIYDVELTLDLPRATSATSALNALAHAVEALYARDANPVTSLLADDAIAALARALPKIVAAPNDIAARTDALRGAWLAGTCLGSVGMALHHKLCHVLGGSFELPHAETHAVVLPHVIAYNRAAAPDAMAHISRALGGGDAAAATFELARAVGAPASLAELGMPASGIDRAAELALATPYWNPRPLELGAIRELIARAHAGAQPI